MVGDEVAVKFDIGTSRCKDIQTFHGKILGDDLEGYGPLKKHFRHVYFGKDQSIEALRLIPSRWGVPPKQATKTPQVPDKYWCFWGQYTSHLELQSSRPRARAKSRMPSMSSPGAARGGRR